MTLLWLPIILFRTNLAQEWSTEHMLLLVVLKYSACVVPTPLSDVWQKLWWWLEAERKLICGKMTYGWFTV